MPKKQLQGVVISDKMEKTALVRVERWVMNKKYKKRHKKSKNYKADDENNDCKKGEKVLIEETRPISKNKTWKVVKKI